MNRINTITIVLVVMLMLAGCAVGTDDRAMPIHESDFTRTNRTGLGSGHGYL